MNFAQVPVVFQLGNLALGAAEAMDERRAEQRVANYNRALSHLDESIRNVDGTLANMRGGQQPNWAQVAQQAGVHLDAALSILRTLGHTGLGTVLGLQDFDVPIPAGDQGYGVGPTTAQMGHGTTQPSAWSAGGPQLTTMATRLRSARLLVARLRDAEGAVLLQRRVSGGGSGLGNLTGPGGPSWTLYLSLAMVAAAAYHGQRRGGTTTSAVKWAAVPLLFGYMGGVVTLAIAAAQGFGQAAKTGT